MISKTHNTINLIYCQSQKFNSKRRIKREMKKFFKEGWQQSNLYLRRNVMNSVTPFAIETHSYLQIRIKINFCNIKRRTSKKKLLFDANFSPFLALCDAKRCLKIIKISRWKLDCFRNVTNNRCRRKIRDDYGTETKIIAQRHSLKYFFIASRLLSL
mgnify:CR=1 FL=1